MSVYMGDSVWTGAYNIPSETAGLDYETARDATPQVYGVSSGNGNDGVSHMYPDYYVRTCDPWTLARLAIITMHKPAFQDWIAENADIDGEYYTIYATIYAYPRDESDDSDDDYNGPAECCVEVFLVDSDDVPDQSDPCTKRVYDNLQAAFGADDVARWQD